MVSGRNLFQLLCVAICMTGWESMDVHTVSDSYLATSASIVFVFA